jgi:hypothetical protein
VKIIMHAFIVHDIGSLTALALCLRHHIFKLLRTKNYADYLIYTLTVPYWVDLQHLHHMPHVLEICKNFSCLFSGRFKGIQKVKIIQHIPKDNLKTDTTDKDIERHIMKLESMSL